MTIKDSGPDSAEFTRRAVLSGAIITITSLATADTALAIGGLGGGGGGRGGDAGDGADGDDHNRRYRTAGLRVEFEADGKSSYRFAYDVTPSEKRGAHEVSFNLITYIAKHKAWNRIGGVGNFKRRAKVKTKALRPKPGKYAVEIMGHGFGYDVAVERGEKVEKQADPDKKNRRASKRTEYVFTEIARKTGTV